MRRFHPKIRIWTLAVADGESEKTIAARPPDEVYQAKL
jgi:hypothetical protein